MFESSFAPHRDKDNSNNGGVRHTNTFDHFFHQEINALVQRETKRHREEGIKRGGEM